MTRGLKMFTLLLATGALTGCVSSAVSMLDGIADAAAGVGARSLYTVDEEACRADPALLAKKGVDLEFGKQRTFSLASSKCQERFDVAVNEQTFAADFHRLVIARCTDPDGQAVQTAYCTSSLAEVDPAATAQTSSFTPDLEKMRNYEVGTLACDNDMFRRKRNIELSAQIEATELCFENGDCYRKSNLIDRNRSTSFGPSSSWANERDTPRMVKFSWGQTEADIEQVFIQTPEAFPLANYTIEVTLRPDSRFRLPKCWAMKTRRSATGLTRSMSKQSPSKEALNHHKAPRSCI